MGSPPIRGAKGGLVGFGGFVRSTTAEPCSLLGACILKFTLEDERVDSLHPQVGGWVLTVAYASTLTSSSRYPESMDGVLESTSVGGLHCSCGQWQCDQEVREWEVQRAPYELKGVLLLDSIMNTISNHQDAPGCSSIIDFCVVSSGLMSGALGFSCESVLLPLEDVGPLPME